LSYSVSVILPHYKDLAGLEKAIKSVYAQSRLADQVIVVDDDSGAEDWGKLEKLAKEYGFELYHKTNQGQSAARNFGVTKSRSSHICFLDQDDLFLENHIEDLLSAWEDNPRLAFVYGDTWRQSENGEVYVRTTYRTDFDIETVDVFDLARRDILVTPGMTMYSKEHFLAVGGFDPSLRGYEDDDLIFRLAVKGYSGKRIENAVLIWTLNLSSTSFSISMQRSRDIYFRKLHAFFTQPFFAGMGLSPFRDILIGRFYKQMMNDAIRLAKTGGSDFAVVQQNLRIFCELGLASKGITSKQRRSLKFSKFAITSFPPNTIQIAFDFAIRMKRLLRF
jgi:glycosyltransferase involved in cell wall biosynthesis